MSHFINGKLLSSSSIGATTDVIDPSNGVDRRDDQPRR